jgi:hypothetical protein
MEDDIRDSRKIEGVQSVTSAFIINHSQGF